jgi:hypothetical protein
LSGYIKNVPPNLVLNNFRLKKKGSASTPIAQRVFAIRRAAIKIVFGIQRCQESQGIAAKVFVNSSNPAAPALYKSLKSVL